MIEKRPNIFILMALISYPSFCAILYTPALPVMSIFFGVTDGLIQQSMTTFLLGYALGQLIYGPISNAFGRKKAIYFGILLSILGAFGCVVSYWVESLWVLLISRFIQAFGASCGINMTFTCINDCFEGKQARDIYALMPMSFAVVPILGVLFGGVLTEFFSWEFCFYFLILSGLLLLKLVTKLPESNSMLDRFAIRWQRVLISYFDTLKETTMLLYALVVGCGIAIYYIFAILAPFIATNNLSLTGFAYGEISLILGAGYLLGSLLSRGIDKIVRERTALLIGIIIETCAILGMLLSFSFGFVNIFSLFFLMMAVFFGQAFVFSNATLLGLRQAVDRATSSSMMSFIFISFSVIAVLSAGLLHRHEAIDLPMFLISFIALMWIIFFIAAKKEKQVE
ncbi:MAG: Bicyclomycin resistance protein [Chlamydiae bacterium]|nr:Bicyclomycin resistance protein [Chlamydiota bacterium]